MPQRMAECRPDRALRHAGPSFGGAGRATARGIIRTPPIRGCISDVPPGFRLYLASPSPRRRELLGPDRHRFEPAAAARALTAPARDHQARPPAPANPRRLRSSDMPPPRRVWADGSAYGEPDCATLRTRCGHGRYSLTHAARQARDRDDSGAHAAPALRHDPPGADCGGDTIRSAR